MNADQVDLTLWVLWTSGSVVILCVLALLLMRFARKDLPPNPTPIQRLQHALWNNL